MDQLEVSATQTISFHSKRWPVGVLEDRPLSLYIIVASESDEGLVSSALTNKKCKAQNAV